MEKSRKMTSVTTILLLAFGLLASTTLLAFTLVASAAEAKPASVRLQEGLYAEEIEGDLDAAIKIYEQIISDDSAQKSCAAQAMYRLGMCHLKKKNEQSAKAIFEKLIVQFPDQTSIIDKVEPLLDEMTNPDPAALMPPGTKIYLELGSPGRQIEKILNMLKGTPFENPLAAIGGGSQPGAKSPGDMMAALLNPSMMQEFKKVRGMAVGFMAVPINISNPPVAAVLYPGKSDALRGIVLAALGMALQPGEPIEGMQTLRMGDNGGAAYDDEVIIIAQPLEQLTWCVKQYKGVSQEPTLASENKLFAKLSRKNREDNAVTIWLDGAATFAAVAEQMEKGGEADELRLIDGIADFNSFEEVVAYLSIQEKGVGVEVNVGFKDGHRCLAYDLIRTPNLSRDGFEAVPSETIALVSFALGESESRHAEAAQKTIQKLTGLDVGREIFANIKQITLFAVPPSPASKESGATEHAGPFSCIGLAVTSDNPQKTRMLFTRLLGLADLIANASNNDQSKKQPDPANGRYYVGSLYNTKIHCYMEQAGSTTILALSPDILKACVSAQKTQESALIGGPLRGSLGSLPPDSSKLVLVNVGGAIRVADSYIAWMFDNPKNPGHRLFGQLAQACDKTSVKVHTGEELSSFNLHVGVDELPSLGAVFPLLMQLSQTDLQAKARATEPKPAEGSVVSAADKLELIWEPGASVTAHRVYFGTDAGQLPLLGEVKESGYDRLPALEKNATYYWRIDEVQPDGSVIAGDVWSLSTGKLVAWWKFDEASGTRVADSAGNDYHGTVVEGKPIWEPDGKYGQCLNFDETYGISIPKEVFGGIDRAITISVWVNGNENQPDHGNVILKAGAGQRGLPYIVTVHTKWKDDGEVRFETGLSETDKVGYSAALEEWAGRWNHYAFVKGAEKGFQRIYLNGTLVAEKTGTTASMAGVDAARIGIAPDRFGDQYIGKLDDLRIYNYALSQEEIAELCPMPGASGPKPAKGAVVGPTTDLKLSWRPGTNATAHRVYFGASAGELSLLAEVESPGYDKLPELERATTYYWRIDEVQADGSVVTGDVWTFSTGGLVGRWKFDETSGSTAVDSSGNGYHGKVTGAEWVTGQVGGALKFDGEDYVSIPEAAFSSIRNQITIAFWQYGDPAKQPQKDSIFEGRNSNGERLLNLHLPWYNELVHWDGGKVENVPYHPGKYEMVRISKQAKPEEYEGRWNHWTVTKDADTGEMKIYLNGALWHSGSGKTSTIAGVTTFNIGSYAGAIGSFYAGLIDDFRIYNYALGEDEVAGLCPIPAASGPKPRNQAVVSSNTELKLSWRPGENATAHRIYFGTSARVLSLLAEVDGPGYDELPTLEKGTEYYWRIDEVRPDGSVVTGDVWSFSIGKLVGWWKFDEGEGSTAQDSSGNNNQGVIVGDPAWVAGRIGSALEFDGVDDHVDIPDHETLEGMNELTINMWVKPTGLADYSCIIHKGHWQAGFVAHTGSSGDIWWGCYDRVSKGSAILSPGTWQLITL